MVERIFRTTPIRATWLAVILTAVLSATAWGQERVHSVFFEGTDHELNVYRIHGKEPGKTLLLIGGIQGDEPGGFLSADLYADISLERGNLIVVPRANFHSIVLKRRKVNEDMNRQFDDDHPVTYEAEVVAILKKLIAESDCLLNLHDGSGFYSHTWQGPNRNPRRYGQSIIADADDYSDPQTGLVIELGQMARSVCENINRKIANPGHRFHFNNHRTAEKDSLHREQRKSATFYALTRHRVPAFGIESSKSLPLETKVRHHNLAINAFMERFGIVPETPGMNLKTPKLDYLVIAINDGPALVVRDGQTLHVDSGDNIEVSHIEANYERGLSADILGCGAINDLRKKVRIEKPTRIVIRKDFYPSGTVHVAVEPAGARRKSATTDGRVPLFFKVRCNEVLRYYTNYSNVRLVRGDRIELVDVFTPGFDSSRLEVNFKGFVGNTRNNTGEDRGYVIHTDRDLWKRYSLDRKGYRYQVVVSTPSEPIGKLYFQIEDPTLKYFIVRNGKRAPVCLFPGDKLTVQAGGRIRLEDVRTNIDQEDDLRVFLTTDGSGRQPVPLREWISLPPGAVETATVDAGRLEVHRGTVPFGFIGIRLTGEGS